MSQHDCLQNVAARLEGGITNPITLFCAECGKVFTPIVVDEVRKFVYVSQLEPKTASEV